MQENCHVTYVKNQCASSYRYNLQIGSQNSTSQFLTGLLSIGQRLQSLPSCRLHFLLQKEKLFRCKEVSNNLIRLYISYVLVLEGWNASEVNYLEEIHIMNTNQRVNAKLFQINLKHGVVFIFVVYVGKINSLITCSLTLWLYFRSCKATNACSNCKSTYYCSRSHQSAAAENT